MPGAAKPYSIKAFLFDCDRPLADSHWFDWEFDVVGLSSLPRELAARIGEVIGPLAADTEHVWTTKRLPMLRNSLCYHGAEHGVTGFPATTLEGKTYKVRVFAYGNAKPATYKLTTTLHVEREPDTVLKTWEYSGPDLTAAVGSVHHLIGEHFLFLPPWHIRQIVQRIKKSIGNKRNETQQAFAVNSEFYIARFAVTKEQKND